MWNHQIVYKLPQFKRTERKQEYENNKVQPEPVSNYKYIPLGATAPAVTADLSCVQGRVITEEMKKLDDVVYNPSPQKQNIMHEKSCNLAETRDLVIKVKENDAPKEWVDLNKLWA